MPHAHGGSRGCSSRAGAWTRRVECRYHAPTAALGSRGRFDGSASGPDTVSGLPRVSATAKLDRLQSFVGGALVTDALCLAVVTSYLKQWGLTPRARDCPPLASC